ncbi:MAG: cobalt-precorrin-5B (C(1))-methyltransferase [Pseudomonadota bacterium]
MSDRDQMRPSEAQDLRTGYTTGACATAASLAAARLLLGHPLGASVTISLPRGERVAFELVETAQGEGWAQATVQKDAGDDPDVTHGALITARLREGPAGSGITFLAGDGVGRVTRPGLPLPVGSPAINPVPLQMMRDHLEPLGIDFEVTIRIPGGEALAQKTWNPRLGIEGGLSILGTTGIVRPYSCAAWIASIHRGIDVARAAGLTHAVGSTGATSEQVAQKRLGVPDHGMLDMGDFAGGLLKYLRRHPLPRLTLAGGFGKLTKLSQGALDLHSARSQVDFARLADVAEGLPGADQVPQANTALEALTTCGPELALRVAQGAREVALDTLGEADIALDVLVISRSGEPLAEADQTGARCL